MGEQTKMIKAIVIASLAAVALAEAEADPYLLYGGHLGYAGLGYGLGYGHLGYGYGHRYLYGKREAEAEPEAKPEAEADPYLLYGHGRGYYGGLRYYGKRSADAEADPYLLYGGHLGYRLGGYYG